MKSKPIFLFILFLAIILLVNFGNSDSFKTKVNKQVIEAFEEKEIVRVVVTFEENNLKNFPPEIKGKIKHKLKGKFSIEVNEKDIGVLENFSFIESVGLVGEKILFLEESVPLMNATITWNQSISGVNLTGLGESICVLDTGVDFTHPDLIGKNITCVIDCFSGTSCVQNCSAGDYEGHGTHVAGTIGANGTLKGVAPDAMIFGVKVCGLFGENTGCFDDDLRAGIDWCVDNSATYNISVISISLGSEELYNSYCDGMNDDFGITIGINNAIAKNISVIVATGNDANFTHIASPACVRNATAVGMSYDANVGGIAWGIPVICTDETTFQDKIVCASNRNNLTDLFAPGALINSTIPEGYGDYGGTSMATPHVSGAFALINQFKKMEGKTITPLQIQNSLNSTGKIIEDPLSLLNFSRIDVYSAILSLDETPPIVELISPSTNVFNHSVTFKCNATDELQLDNLTLVIWNSTSLVNETIEIASSNNHELSLSLELFEGEYEWNCFAYDSVGNNNYALLNYTLSVARILSYLNEPSNNSYINQNETNFTCFSETSSDANLTNVTLYIWNSSFEVYSEPKIISGQTNSTNFSYTLINEETYFWNCLSFNNNSESNFASSNNSITLDKTLPKIDLLNPEEGYSTTPASLDFSFNLTEENPSNCSLIINRVSVSEISSEKGENAVSQTLSSGSYSWSINCTDLANNTASSSFRNFTIFTEETPRRRGGGGGSSIAIIAPKEYDLTESQVQEGTNKFLKVNDKLKFNLKNESHILSVNNISSQTIIITITSEPIILSINLNETRKINIDNDGFFDLEVKYNSFKNNYANLSIREINEEIPYKFLLDSEQEQLNGEEENIEDGKENKKNLIFYLFLFLIIIFLILLFLKSVLDKNCK